MELLSRCEQLRIKLFKRLIEPRVFLTALESRHLNSFHYVVTRYFRNYFYVFDLQIIEVVEG